MTAQLQFDDGGYITLGLERQGQLVQLALRLMADDWHARSDAAKLPAAQFRFVTQYVILRQLLKE